MNLITILKKFESKHRLYNGFQARTMSDVRVYSEYLNNLSDDFFTEIKEQIEKILLNENPIHVLELFIKAKMSDLKDVEEKLNIRNTYIARTIKEEQHYIDNYPNEGGIMGITVPSRTVKIYEIAQDYFNNIIDSEVLLQSLCSYEIDYYDGISISIMMEKSQRDLIQKSIDKINELYTFYFPKDIKPQVNHSKIERDFKSYLHHDNKDVLMEKLHELLEGKKGKVVAITIKALEQLGFISVTDRRSALYKVMRDEFGEIGSDQSINPIMNNFAQYSLEIEQQIKILKEVK